MSGPNAALRRVLQAFAHPQWAWDVGLLGKPHDLGNVSAYRGKPTSLEDYIGWLGANFDPSISWKDLEWIREFWDGPMIIKSGSGGRQRRGALRRRRHHRLQPRRPPAGRRAVDRARHAGDRRRGERRHHPAGRLRHPQRTWCA